jgi:uncharacterized damage-inducible protein DinB
MKEQLLATLENSRNYTLQVAEGMPSQSYQFKPVETVWNFRELMHHIAYGIQWWEENHVKGNQTAWSPIEVKNNKKEVIAYLNLAFDSLRNTVHKQKVNDENLKGFNATIDHITHHRGQAVTYLRCCGITPPDYVY